MYITIVTTYLFLMNMVAFVAYVMDKRYAFYNRWRIPELCLIGLAVIGGAYGAQAAMLLFRHKTRHTLFVITVPICLLIWIGLYIWFYYSNLNVAL